MDGLKKITGSKNSYHDKAKVLKRRQGSFLLSRNIFELLTEPRRILYELVNILTFSK